MWNKIKAEDVCYYESTKWVNKDKTAVDLIIDYNENYMSLRCFSVLSNSSITIDFTDIEKWWPLGYWKNKTIEESCIEIAEFYCDSHCHLK